MACGLPHVHVHTNGAMPKGGKSKDKRGGGQKMAYREERNVSSEEEEEKEEEKEDTCVDLGGF